MARPTPVLKAFLSSVIACCLAAFVSQRLPTGERPGTCTTTRRWAGAGKLVDRVAHVHPAPAAEASVSQHGLSLPAVCVLPVSASCYLAVGSCCSCAREPS